MLNKQLEFDFHSDIYKTKDLWRMLLGVLHSEQEKNIVYIVIVSIFLAASFWNLGKN